jgi:long-chain acyl-CoA synthetase
LTFISAAIAEILAYDHPARRPGDQFDFSLYTQRPVVIEAPKSAWPSVSVAAAYARLTAPSARFELEEVVIRGVTTRVWKNAPLTLRDVFLNGRQFNARTFLVYENDRATFDAFGRAVTKLASELQRKGLSKGDRVALIMRNLPEWPVAFFAASIVGAIVVPMNAWWTGPELEFALLDSGASVAIVDGERFERVAQRLNGCPRLEHVYVARRTGNVANRLAMPLEDVLGPVNEWNSLPENPLPNVRLTPEDDATIFYTSGTTGKPKGALATHRNMGTNIMTGACLYSLAFLRRGEKPPEPGPNDPPRVSLAVVPMFHVTGCNGNLIPSLNAGAKLVLMRKWDPEQAMELIARERVTAMGGVPTIAWQLIEHPSRTHYDLSSLQAIAYGGAPSPPELVRRIKEVFPLAVAGNAWGMTETSGTFTGHSSEDYEHRPDSCGPPTPVGEIKIMSVDGTRKLAIGEVGELWVKGPQVIKGYWNSPDATAETFINGWLKTGDLARIDEEGFCYVVDRVKDMVIRGGENIYSIQVEKVLSSHPAVVEAALVGLVHKTLGEEPGAVVHLRAGATVTETELREFVGQRLASFQVPVKIVFWPEPLPRNAAGKVLKRALMKAFEVQPPDPRYG